MKETLNLSHGNTALPPSFKKYEVTHAATTNSATWREALAGSNTPTNGYLLTKTLIFKPKVAKTQTARLIVVVALDDTATSAAQIAKAASEKEARFANADTVKEILGVTVEQGYNPPLIAKEIGLQLVSPLSISNESASQVQVLIDSKIIASEELLAFHPSDASKTVFITSKQLREYLESTGVKVTEVEFTAAPVGK